MVWSSQQSVRNGASCLLKGLGKATDGQRQSGLKMMAMQGSGLRELLPAYKFKGICCYGMLPVVGGATLYICV